MADERYEYEVAFSFVKDDEAIATALNDLLQDRLSTFLYSKRQEELAGTDGEQSFNEIFKQLMLSEQVWIELLSLFIVMNGVIPHGLG